jgi:acetylornithine deacetylase/succinyl-diaminopimelate desuccinylase-like protein
MSSIKKYIDENLDLYLDELFTLLKVASVSSLESHKNEMSECAGLFADYLKQAGTDIAEVYETDGHPVVYAEKLIKDAEFTVLVYGHYDVQPVDPIELWKSDPFEPEIRDGAIFARGANDDKGQTFMHLKAFQYLVKNEMLKCNVKFLIEGEEEVGSPSLTKWVENNKERLSCDMILVSDTTMLGENVPSINCGMRGLAYIELKVTGPDRDLHSGHYGGAIANPLNELCKIIASLTDDKGRITVPGFYDDVVELTSEERSLLGKAPFNEAEFKKSIDINQIKGETGYSTIERIGIRPSLDVCGIWGGYTGEGAKTILPSYAQAKISMRLVPNQDNYKITQLFIDHINSIAPDYIKVTAKAMHGGQGFLTPISSPVYKAASDAIKQVYGIEPVPSRGGGSIPVLADMQSILNANPLLMGFGLERDTIHSPNESFLISQFKKGIESIIRFYINISE